MKMLSIFFRDDSELTEFEARNKGSRADVYVKTEDGVYNINVYDIFTLKQDFEREQRSYGYYSIEPNLILVNEANKTEIIETIKNLYEQKF